MEAGLEQAAAQARAAAAELLDVAGLKPGDIFVVGCSSSEVLGGRIGKASSVEAAQAVFEGVYPVLQGRGVYLAAQCCEHLNRALLSSLPQLAQKSTKLYSITGTPPSLYNQIVGDAFAPRNPYCLEIDTLAEPPLFQVSDTHFAKTWLLDPRAPKIEKPESIQGIHEKLMAAFNI